MYLGIIQYIYDQFYSGSVIDLIIVIIVQKYSLLYLYSYFVSICRFSIGNYQLPIIYFLLYTLFLGADFLR